MLKIRFVSKDEFIIWLMVNRINTLTAFFRYFAENGEFVCFPLNPCATYGVTYEDLGLVDDSNYNQEVEITERLTGCFFTKETLARYLCEYDVRLTSQYSAHCPNSPARLFLPTIDNVKDFIVPSWRDLKRFGYFSLDEFKCWLCTYGYKEMGCDLRLSSYNKHRKISKFIMYLPEFPVRFYGVLWANFTHYDINGFRKWLREQGITRHAEYVAYLKAASKSELRFLYQRPARSLNISWACIMNPNRPLPFSKSEFLGWIGNNKIASLEEYMIIRRKLDNNLAARCPRNPLKTYNLADDIFTSKAK